MMLTQLSTKFILSFLKLLFSYVLSNRTGIWIKFKNIYSFENQSWPKSIHTRTLSLVVCCRDIYCTLAWFVQWTGRQTLRGLSGWVSTLVFSTHRSWNNLNSSSNSTIKHTRMEPWDSDRKQNLKWKIYSIYKNVQSCNGDSNVPQWTMWKTNHE